MYPFVNRRLPDQIVLAAAADYGRDHFIDLPRQHDIQQIAITIQSAGFSSVGSILPFPEDNPMSLIHRITLMANGTTPIRSISGASLYYKNLYDNHGVGNIRTLVVAAAVAQFNAQMLFDFKRNPQNKLDTSMLLPAHKFSSLRLVFNIGQLVGDICDVVAAIGVVTISVDITYVKVNAEKPVWDILYEAEENIPIAVAHAVFATQNLEGMGQKIRRLTLIARDAAAAPAIRSDVLMLQCKIRDSKMEYEPFDLPWNAIRALDLTDYSLKPAEFWNAVASVPIYDQLAAVSTIRGTIAGMAMIDFDKQGDMTLAYPTGGYSLGDLVLQFTNAAPAGVVSSLTYIIEYLRSEHL